MHILNIKTHKRSEMISVTSMIDDLVSQSGVKDGLVVAFVPHTTSGVTLNENADPDVVHDMLMMLDNLVPRSQSGYRHGEGNSDAHIKTSLIGSSVSIILDDGKMQLGTWQGIFFCEFDGPRSRRLLVDIIEKS